ncbi:MAG: hypothetical protein R3B13_04770 [Polyangiaceae bacterium]
MVSFEAEPGSEERFELQSSAGAAESTLLVGDPVCHCGAALPAVELGNTETISCRGGGHPYHTRPLPILLREAVPAALQVIRSEDASSPRYWVVFQGTPRVILDQRRVALEAVIKERAAPLAVTAPEGPVSLQVSSFHLAKQSMTHRKERAPPWMVFLVILTLGAGLAWYAAGQMKKKSQGARVEEAL